MKKINVIATIILLILDFIWIGVYMGPQYNKLVENIQSFPMEVNLFSAIISYTLMIIGLNLFVLPNVTKETPFVDCLRYGFVFGIILYGVYDFTAGSVFKKWDFNLAVIDVLWGGFVYFISSYLATKFINQY
jgi:uncharacterized membrane protein